MKGKIRSAIRDDIKQITELCNSDPQNLLGDSENKYDEKDIEDYLNNRLNRIWVCELNEEIIGVLITQFWKNYVYLHTIVVDEKYRGKGIGKMLMDCMENLAKEQGKYVIELYTEVKNKKMQNLIKKREYKKGDKFIFYSKNLK
jgi:ribosomal protein S18 acetylase RimI-like enzyme